MLHAYPPYKCPMQDRLAEEALLRDVESALRDLAAATGEVEAARQERHQLQVGCLCLLCCLVISEGRGHGWSIFNAAPPICVKADGAE